MNRLIVILVVVLFPVVALAAEDRAADAMIARGLELRRSGKSEEALEMFQRAHALAPSPRTLGQMGLVEGSLEHWTDAENHLTAAISAAYDDWVRRNQKLLQNAMDSVKSHIGQLVFSGPPGAAVTVANKLIGTLPDIPPVRVAAGTVLVTASAPGSKQFVRSVDVQAGMQTAISITLEPIDLKPTPRLADTTPATSPILTELQPHYSWKTWTGGALVGVGAAVAIWGITWVAVDGKSAGGNCPESTAPNCRPVYDTRTPGWILAGAGAATALGGGILLYTARSSGSDVTVSLGPSSFRVGGQF